jgi:hypothetical protein
LAEQLERPSLTPGNTLKALIAQMQLSVTILPLVTDVIRQVNKGQ